MVMCKVARTANGTDGPDTELNHVNKAPLRHSQMTVNFDSCFERQAAFNFPGNIQANAKRCEYPPLVSRCVSHGLLVE